MDPIKDIIKKKLGTPEEEISYPRFGWDNPKYDSLEEPARRVMTSYQNANRWLDTIKEHLLINLHCPYLSHIVHELAHKMPMRFDSFGDILHTENLVVPYPSTEEWSGPLGDASSCIESIYDILDSIRISLTEFKQVAENAGFYSMSISTDELLVGNSNEYYYFHRIEGLLEHLRSDLTTWDKRCYELYRNQENLH